MSDERLERLALVRCRPGSDACDRLSDWLSSPSQDDSGRRLFLHGDGVEYAGDVWRSKIADLAGPRTELEVCRTSWHRRYAEPPRPPFRQASLGRLCRAVREGVDIECFGLIACESAGGRVAPSTDQHARRGSYELLVEIGFAPAGRFKAIEALEFALAAAALELDARVRFFGPGLEHLARVDGRGWCQITDYRLLGLYADRSARAVVQEPTAPVIWLDPSELARLRTDAATIIRL
ncbi:MAG: hypothetical protein ABR550_05200 [Wenzhouxiangellaceae bacterium]